MNKPLDSDRVLNRDPTILGIQNQKFLRPTSSTVDIFCLRTRTPNSRNENRVSATEPPWSIGWRGVGVGIKAVQAFHMIGLGTV